MTRVIFFILMLLNGALSGCGSVAHQQALLDQDALPGWMQQVISYQDELSSDHPHNMDSLFSISDSMRETVQNQFGSLPRSMAVRRLANWLVDEQGHAMIYDINANYTPIQAFKQGRGNCLSFTILLASLAEVLNIKVQYNEVDLPNIWSLQEGKGFILYRHVNGLYKNFNENVIFDLAIEQYDYNFPQRVISKELAAAKLLSNLGIDALGRDNYAAAEHYLKLAISLVPESSDLWVNYGTVLKRQGFNAKAEQAFRHSFAHNRYNRMAASNLERLYRTTGETKLANRYERVAQRLRDTNPYYHFGLAQKYYAQGLLKRSRKSIQRAKRLHNSDPRFYELSSRLYQRNNDLARAFRDLRKAHKLAVDIKSQGRYAMKALRLNQLALKSSSNSASRSSNRRVIEGEAIQDIDWK